MKNLLTLLLVTAFLFQSCGNGTEKKTTETEKDTIVKERIDTSDEPLEYQTISQKIEVDFAKNKDLLDIILLLPDSSFDSWKWTLEDRTKWYNEIKTNGFYIDDNPNYFTQKYFEPHEAGFQIVDGFWSINIYQTVENSYIVITDDMVGDGNFLCFYEVKSNTIQPFLDEETIFSNFKELLKKEDVYGNCDEKFEELNSTIFDYAFLENNMVEIGSSWYLTKEDYADCLIGNSIRYKFNPETKKFDVEKIYWQAKQEQ